MRLVEKQNREAGFTRMFPTYCNIWLLPALGNNIYVIDGRTEDVTIYQSYPEDFEYIGLAEWSMFMKNVLIWTRGNANWMGGVYYTRNLLFQLSSLDNIKEEYCFFLCVDFNLVNEYVGLDKLLNIQFIEKREEREQLLKLCDQYDIDVVLPMEYDTYSWVVSDICVYWIPDFQEIHLPQNFPKRVLEERAQTRSYIASKHKSLMLSSKDAYRDYCNQYPEYLEHTHIVHFVSYIEKILEKIDDKYTEEIMEKYGINYEYIYVANQFWKHKNHIVVLKAIDRIIKSGRKDIHLVCTGFMESYGRAKDEYVEMLKDYVREHDLQNNVHFLGLIGREEQLCIMKNANLLVQPSLFEGWGCSVEDAKVMGKTILLSDLAVHEEQKGRNTILFSKEDEEQLAELVIEQFKCVYKYNLDEGKRVTYLNAKKYAQELKAAIEEIQQRNETSYMDKLQQARQKKVKELFCDMDARYIGIYGTGAHTDSLMKSCRQILKDDISFTYFDSNESKWGKEYQDKIIHSPQEILETGVRRIIISSSAYQDEIYEALKIYQQKIEIVKIYSSTEEKNELLWA